MVPESKITATGPTDQEVHSNASLNDELVLSKNLTTGASGGSVRPTQSEISTNNGLAEGIPGQKIVQAQQISSVRDAQRIPVSSDTQTPTSSDDFTDGRASYSDVIDPDTVAIASISSGRILPTSPKGFNPGNAGTWGKGLRVATGDPDSPEQNLN